MTPPMLNLPLSKPAAHAPSARSLRPACSHGVRFYDREEQIAGQVWEFIAPVLKDGGSAVVVARPSLRLALAARSAIAMPEGGGRLQLLDAQAELDGFLVEGWPDGGRFRQTVGRVVEQAAAAGRGVRVYGEMVGLLCEQGRCEAALRLEQLWNGLAEELDFALMCGYPWHLFADAEQAAMFDHVCRLHDGVRAQYREPLDDEPDMERRLAYLEQKARALEREIERRRVAEQELAAASRAKDEFLAMLGHELRNPLSPIVAALELMRLRGAPGTHSEQAIIQRQVGHLVRLVDDLLDVARVSRGRIELRRERVRLDDVLARAMEMSSGLMERQRHRLVVHVERGLHCDADPVRLAQVVANLLGNAARYTDPGGEIVLAVRAHDGEIVLSVSDNGRGMPPEQLPRVFELFFQGERTLESAGGGLGIGLALVKKLVELHGGSVQARSEGIGRGSEFTVRWPACEGARDTLSDTASTSSAALVSRPRRLLVVDDNVDAATTLGELLRMNGHEVEVCHDAASAMSVVARCSPECAVLDIGLPVVDGYALAGELRQRLGPTCRLIALTGFGAVADCERARAAGFDSHLTKPADPRRLLALIDGTGA
jgi:signal transduction histidine kinase/CheY-like chemotaxis protein